MYRHKDDGDDVANTLSRDTLIELLFDNNPDGVALADSKGRWQAVNDRYCRMLGYSEPHLLALSLAELAAEGGGQESHQLLAQALKEGATRCQIRQRHQSGQPIDLEVTVRRLLVEDEACLLFQFRELSDYALAQEALRESETNLRLLAENANDGILVNLNDVHVFGNRRILEMLGYTLEEFCQTRTLDLVHPDERPKILDRYQRRLAGEPMPARYETIFIAKDGHPVPVEIAPSITRWEGQPAGLVVVRDITERKKAERREQQLTRLLRTISEINQAIMREKDGQAILQAACRILVEMGEFRMAWVGMADSETGRVLPVAQAGEVGDYLDNIEIRCDDTPQGRGPSGVAIRSGHYVINNHVDDNPAFAPWASGARRLGYHASAAFPLTVQGSVIGVVNVYAQAPDAFGEEEVSLLNELTEDIGFALQTIENASRHKISQQALAESEDRFRRAFEDAPIGMALVGLDQRFIQVNQALCRILGYDRKTLLTKTAEDITHPDDRKRDNELKQQVRAAGLASVETTKRYLHADGHVVWGRMSLSLLRDAQGEPMYFIGQMEDITQQKLAQEALEESNNLLKAVVEGSPDAIYMKDLQGRHLLINTAMATLLSRSQSEILGKTDAEIFPPEEAAQFTESDRRVIESGLTETWEEAVELNGQQRIFVVTKGVYCDHQGRTIGLFGMSHDITRRKRREEALRQSEDRFSKAFDASPVMLTISTIKDGRFIDANKSFLEASGYTRDELLGRSVHEIGLWVIPEQRDEFIRALREHGKVSNADILAHTKSGQLLNVLMSAQPITIGDEPCMLVAATDISERKRVEAQMRKLSSALEQTADSVMVTDQNGVIEYVNVAFELATGYSKQDVLGKQSTVIRSDTEDGGFQEQLWKQLQNDGVFRDVLLNRRKSGEIYYEEVTVTPLKDDDKVTHFIFTGKDITERIQTQERLQYLAHHDVLTELPNRMLFMERLSRAVTRARWNRRMVAVLFLDLDRFKMINDTLGHDVGDQALQAMSERVSTCIRGDDTVARLGGDEFAVLLEDIHSAEDVAPVAAKILSVFAQPFVLGGHELFITTSIGISLFPDDGDDTQTLLKHADIAMYRAKDLGRNAYQFYSSEMSSRAIERLRLETSLRHALERDEFRLYYQPQFDLTAGDMIGIEALLRWYHPEHGIVLPGEFVPLLEETGLIIAVGEWVMKTACRQALVWHQANILPGRLAVNLSGRQFDHPQFVEAIERTVRTVGLSPDLLEFEITESVLMKNEGFVRAAFERLAGMGVRLAIDDFGTGYSSLSYLKRFPIDTFKIDRSFIQDVTHDPDDSAIVQAIIAMARSLNLHVIAEGVETEAQQAFLREHQCDGAQGFLYSHPLPADKLTELLKARSGG